MDMKQFFYLTALIFSICALSCSNNKTTKNESESHSKDLKIELEPVSEKSVLKNPDYNIWGASMTQTEDGTCHLFYTQWPFKTGFKGWLKNSDIVYATSDSPTGPYETQKIVLTGFGEGHWNEEAAHNPHIKKFGDKYYLYFISHRKEDLGLDDWMNHIFTQRIGVAVANHPAGPWEVLPEALIDYQEGKPAYGYMVNPSVCETPDGNYLMMFKARKPGAEKSGKFDPIHCLATSPTPTGPFTIAEETLLTEATAEDPFLWYQKGKYYSVVKDMHAHYTGFKSLALFESEDGLNWGPSENIMISKTEIVWESGDTTQLINLERPQIWFDKEGNPAVLFCAAREKVNEGEPAKPTYNVHIPLKIIE
jgi:hypothetical protein